MAGTGHTSPGAPGKGPSLLVIGGPRVGLCTHTDVYLCMHICAHVYTHTCTEYTYTYAYVYLCTWALVYTCVHTHMHSTNAYAAHRHTHP